MSNDAELSETVRAQLARFHADRVPQESLRERLRANAADPEALHRLREPVRPPPESCVLQPPAPGSAQEAELRAEGEAMLARGELAVVVLAGGMATRFGSTVKALAQVLEGRAERFLDLKLRDAERTGVDLTLMSSFATHDALAEAAKGHAVHLAPQFIARRLTREGEYFLGKDGSPSLYAPGHGDLPEALALSGALARYKSKGVRTVLMMNVDNVGATVDPLLLAQHRRSGARLSVELVDKRAGDKGGLPVQREDGSLVLAEAFRLPNDFPHESFGLFNTNTLWIDLEALEGEHPWTWCVARKKVEDREAIQFERLVGELTWWHPTAWLRVPREGSASRFIPVKDRADLEHSQALLAAVCRERLGLAL